MALFDRPASTKSSASKLRPAHPERICWGCERHCTADDLGCANGSVRAMHPAELFGDDWLEWSEQRNAGVPADASGQDQKKEDR